ncbi:DUF2254 domain-containing protein [Oceanicella sp. SM1341]|uniref:DUF2254 domain-containing protein n=1 Tax=Oceanicella sp. SM1341 TaxID=1548889 RepID=UPI0018E4E304|nr:DUF2254 domain-containing protein [Oceanicella sp. SM1341]
MISKWHWLLMQFSRRLWVRAALLALLGVATALLATLAESLLPWEMPFSVEADAVDRILDILASSMLAVTTFSLSVMVSAYGAATSNVTPRATRLLVQDPTTQNVLAVFLGSFLFSLVGIVALGTGSYGERGRAVLFVVTIAVIGIIVITMLRWIDYLSGLGRVGETTERVEEATSRAIAARLADPYLGGRPAPAGPRSASVTARPVFPPETGYIQHVDVAALSDIAEARGLMLEVITLPGGFVHPGRALLRVEGFSATGLAEEGDAWLETCDALRGCFSLAQRRSFDQDPRFGLCVMAEIASRALSPAINDHGTAIDVLGRSVRLLAPWATAPERATEEVDFPRVLVPGIAVADLFADIFPPIARDGAGHLEVHIRLQKALGALYATGDEAFRACARAQSREAMDRAEAGLALEADREVLRALRLREGLADPEADASRTPTGAGSDLGASPGTGGS